MSTPLLQVRDLVTSFTTDAGVVRAVDGVSFEVPQGATVGLVGESGCGKSVTSLSVMGLIPQPPGRIESGQILFDGQDLTQLPERELRRLRGREIAMIFQEPMTSLNPVFTVGSQIREAIEVHEKVGKKAAMARAVELLQKVGIPEPAERVSAYPHQLSGGMRQRVMIAIALASSPRLLIADEPTTALDVTIQAQILDLLAELQRDTGTSILFITHDLGVVAEQVAEVVVMYAGKVVERGPTAALFADPQHPYTRGLLSSVPSYGDNASRDRLPTIKGVVPDLLQLPSGCRFQDRCSQVMDRCRAEAPALHVLPQQRMSACHLVDGEQVA